MVSRITITFFVEITLLSTLAGVLLADKHASRASRAIGYVLGGLSAVVLVLLLGQNHYLKGVATFLGICDVCGTKHVSFKD